MSTQTQKPDMSTLSPEIAALISRVMDARLEKGLAVEFFYPDTLARTGKPFLAYAATEAKRDAWIASARRKGVLCNAVTA